MTFPPGETPLVVITVRATTEEALHFALEEGGGLIGDLLKRPGIDDARIRVATDAAKPARPKPAAPITAAPCPSQTCPVRPRREQ